MTEIIDYLPLKTKRKLRITGICRCGSRNLIIIDKHVTCCSCDLGGEVIGYSKNGPIIKWNFWCVEDLKNGQHLFRGEERYINGVVKEKCVKCKRIRYTI